MLDAPTAVTTIARWWRRIRSSGRFITFNLKARHTIDFKALLHGHVVPKRLSYYGDLALQQDVIHGNWSARRFRNEKTHYSALNLFAASKITWEQKATISDIIQSAQVYGDFTAYPILDQTGEFTPEANEYLLQFLHKAREQIPLTATEIADFKAAIKKLPYSEQFMFIFHQQRFNEQGSFPTEHDVVRDELLEHYPFLRALHKKTTYPHKNPNANQIEDANGIYLGLTSATHLHELNYQGILKLSYGVENELGRLCYGARNWAFLLPQIGPQSIDDIDAGAKEWYRPTQSGESHLLGLVGRYQNIHGVKVQFTEVMAHDDFHRKYMSFFPREVGLGFNRLIDLARRTFNVRWSKDLWILRDFGFSKSATYSNIPNDAAYITSRFFACLASEYQFVQLDNCDAEVILALEKKQLLADQLGYPNHIAILLILDLVLNPETWQNLGISAQHIKPESRYFDFIKHAILAKDFGFFKNDMKHNVLIFDAYLRNLDPNKSAITMYDCADTMLASQVEPSEYETHRNNKQVFLGFRRISTAATEHDLMCHETLNYDADSEPSSFSPRILKKRNKGAVKPNPLFSKTRY